MVTRGSTETNNKVSLPTKDTDCAITEIQSSLKFWSTARQSRFTTLRELAISKQLLSNRRNENKYLKSRSSFYKSHFIWILFQTLGRLIINGLWLAAYSNNMSYQRGQWYLSGHLWQWVVFSMAIWSTNCHGQKSDSKLTIKSLIWTYIDLFYLLERGQPTCTNIVLRMTVWCDLVYEHI